MTKQELLSLEHLAVAEETKFIHLHTEKGYHITNWFEGDDILEYSGGVCYYMPIRDEYPNYRIITDEEHNMLVEQRNKKYEEEEKERLLARERVLNGINDIND